jgi:hypothetical protein
LEFKLPDFGARDFSCNVSLLEKKKRKKKEEEEEKKKERTRISTCFPPSKSFLWTYTCINSLYKLIEHHL